MQYLKEFSDKYLEDPENPILGPVLKFLFSIGLWRTGNKAQAAIGNCVACITSIIFVFEVIQLYLVRDDMSAMAENLCLTGIATITLWKAVTFIYWQKDWKRLVNGVACEEITQSRISNKFTKIIIINYTNYARIMFYGYGVLTFGAVACLVGKPLLLLLVSDKYSDADEPYPAMVSMWLPFQDARPPGYILALSMQLFVTIFYGSTIFAFDSIVIALMTFFKGHLMILKENCRMLFSFNDDQLTRDIVNERIKECHRHFNSLLSLKALYNSLLSPVMFCYMLVSSLTIGSTVIQFSLAQNEELPTLVFLSVYTLSIIVQLFFYCWHCNDVTIQSQESDRGLYESEWWRADVRTRKDLLLLGGQLSQSFIFEAGPFTVLSINTFISTLRVTYSFYTFLTNK